ncbi:MAG: Eco57I restriction-modification methylase domain-containing protein, partial [Terriglobales bacterium]
LGYAYQYLRRPLRRQAQERVQNADKTVSQAELAAFTQLYTPSWVVDFLLRKTVSACIDTGMEPQRVTVLDPACGAGHFLVRALDLLVRERTARGEAAAEAVENTLKEQLFGADIDPGGLWAAALSLLVRGAVLSGTICDFVWNNIADVSFEELGSLKRTWAETHVLGRKYQAVVTNPPYIGRRLISRSLKKALKQTYPHSCHDLCTAFVERGFDFLAQGGRYGYITQSSLLSLPSYEKLRRLIGNRSCLTTVVELGSGVFPLQGGDKVSSVLLAGAVSNTVPESNHETVFVDLTMTDNKAGALENGAYSTLRNIDEFERSPHFAFHYRCPAFLLSMMATVPSLSAVADIRQGLATTDNDRFLRYWWEVPQAQIGTTWFPYIKGAGTERWTSPILHLVQWGDGGRQIKEAVAKKYPYLKGKTAWVVKNEQYYFRPGLCFSFVSTERFGVRRLPAGCIFDVAASAIFVADHLSDYYLGYLNSSLIRAVCKLLNPTINVQVGDLKRVPDFAVRPEAKEQIARSASRCCALKDALDAVLKPGWNVALPPAFRQLKKGDNVAVQARTFLEQLLDWRNELCALEQSIDRIVLNECAQTLGLSAEQGNALRSWVERETASIGATAAEPELTELLLARRLLVHALPENGQTAGPAALSLSGSATDWLEQTFAKQIDQLVGDVSQSLVAAFYRNRPPAAPAP